MHFKKSFCDKLDSWFHRWVKVTMEKVDEIVLRMEEDHVEVIKYIHKYSDEVTNEMKYCVAKIKTGVSYVAFYWLGFLTQVTRIYEEFRL